MKSFCHHSHKISFGKLSPCLCPDRKRYSSSDMQISHANTTQIAKWYLLTLYAVPIIHNKGVNHICPSMINILFGCDVTIFRAKIVTNDDSHWFHQDKLQYVKSSVYSNVLWSRNCLVLIHGFVISNCNYITVFNLNKMMI